MYIRVYEDHRGLSGSSEYHFVVEGGRLLHISHYAVSQRKLDWGMVEYMVDSSRLQGKEVIEVWVSNSGIICEAIAYPAEDLSLEFSLRRGRMHPLSYLNNFDLAYLTPTEKMFLQTDWKRYYVPMIEELRRLTTTLRGLNPEFPYVILPSLAGCQVESGASYPLSFLIPYSVSARRKSLEALTKEVHQLWVTARIVEELAKLGKLRGAYLDFRQSSLQAIASFQCRSGTCSLWYEFDVNPHTMCEGMLWYTSAPGALRKFYEHVKTVLNKRGLGRAPLRPDIVVLEGGVSCRELLEGFKVKTVIECKNWEYERWAGEVYNQVIPYKEIFQPEVVILASMKKIPDHVKTMLSKHGIQVVDEVHPGGEGERKLLEITRTL